MNLQIRHNEAAESACEYLGVTRMRTDTYFDGTRGKELVKIAIKRKDDKLTVGIKDVVSPMSPRKRRTSSPAPTNCLHPVKALPSPSRSWTGFREEFLYADEF